MDISAEIEKYLKSKGEVEKKSKVEPKVEPIDLDLNSEINSILNAAINTDVSNLEKNLAKTGSTNCKPEVTRCSVCCSQKPRYKCPACFMKVSYLFCRMDGFSDGFPDGWMDF